MIRIHYGCLLLSLCLSSAHAQKNRYTTATERQERLGLPNVFAKIGSHDRLRIAYLGGSITAADGYRPMSLAWFQKQYPDASFEQVDAAVSGTGSTLGAFRLGADVLSHKPDLLFVEFAVNDQGETPARIARAMEGIVRQTWLASPDTDICFLYTIDQLSLSTEQSGHNPPEVQAMERVADFYGIPSINLGLPIAKLVSQGGLVFRGSSPAFSGDGVHPYAETGHKLYLQTLAQALQAMQATAAKPMPHLLSAPLDPLHLAGATEIPLSSATLTGTWSPTLLEDPTGQMHRALPAVFAGRNAGDSITFQFDGTLCGIFGVKGPDAAQFSVQIDHGRPTQQTLFDPYSTAGRYRLRPWFSPDLSPGHHVVTITVLGPTPDKEAILRLGGATAEPLKDNGFALYLGYLLTGGSTPSAGPPGR